MSDAQPSLISKFKNGALSACARCFPLAMASDIDRFDGGRMFLNRMCICVACGFLFRAIVVRTWRTVTECDGFKQSKTCRSGFVHFGLAA